MGWWQAGPNGSSLHTEDTGMVWGDGPADHVDIMFDRVVEAFLEAWGRPPTPEEYEAGLKFGHEGRMEDLATGAAVERLRVKKRLAL